MSSDPNAPSAPQPVPPHPLDPTERARAYPYRHVDHDVEVEPAAATMRAATSADVAAAATTLTAVLAIGSNAAPSQLVHKFGASPCGAEPIVVARAAWRDHDVVHAARVCSYGAVPATFVASVGCTVAVAVTFLTDAQLARMDATEGIASDVYRRIAVDPGGVRLACGIELDEVFAYEATCGPFELDGAQVALSAIDADGRVLAARTQDEVLGLLAEPLRTE